MSSNPKLILEFDDHGELVGFGGKAKASDFQNGTIRKMISNLVRGEQD